MGNGRADTGVIDGVVMSLKKVAGVEELLLLVFVGLNHQEEVDIA